MVPLEREAVVAHDWARIRQATYVNSLSVVHHGEIVVRSVLAASPD
jgi:hypothetical protein